MKILLVNEASGYHHYLKNGLTALGHEVVHAIADGSTLQGRKVDYCFGNSGSSVISKAQRNITPLLRIREFKNFDIANFILGLSVVSGKITRYQDLPIWRLYGVKLSYIGTGCDPFALLRVREDFGELPCQSCMQYDSIGKSCEKRILNERSRALIYSNLVRYTITASCEYDHSHDAFPKALHRRIPFPIDTSSINFFPATEKTYPVIVHAPTRRGFKGTAIILQAIKILEGMGCKFKFRLLENLTFADYMKCMSECDIHIDQVLSHGVGIAALESLAMGKIVVSGNRPIAQEYFPFGKDSPIFGASPNPMVLARTLHEIIRSSDRFNVLAVKGREFVETYHSHIKVAREFTLFWQTP